jgi:hypothetical protein
MAQQLSASQANLHQGSQILELPDLFDLIKVSIVDDFGDDDASFTMEDLMGHDDISPTFEKDANKSHDAFVLGREEKKKFQKYLASCPEINFEKTTTTDSPRKHKSSKKTKRTREAPSRTVSCNAADQRGDTLVRPKRELRKAWAESRSFSCIAEVQTREVRNTASSRQKKESRKSHNDPLHSSVPLYSSFSRIDFEKEEDQRERRGPSINAHQVEFGRSFSSIAHVSGPRKKIDKNDDSFSDVLDKIARWKKTTERDDRLSMRATRTIDIEEEVDVNKVSKEEVSALEENTKRDEAAPARRERSIRKERSAEPAEIPLERKYRRKKSLRATRTIDIEEEVDVNKVSKEEVSALQENTKREEAAPARRERSIRKERSAEPAEIPLERKYRRKKSLRATRTIDIEEEVDVNKVSKEEVSALEENTKREEAAPARRERWSRKERSAEPAEIPFETKYRRKKSLRNMMGGSLRNIFVRSSDDPNRKKMSFRSNSGSSKHLPTHPSDDSKPTSSKPHQPEPEPEPLSPKQELDNYLGQAFMRHLSREFSKSQSTF